ncbi:MAG: SRPBCC family protein [Sphaerimonospora mesophila]
MKHKKLSIFINKPASEVFEFTTNPANTSKWIDSIVIEEANETPVKLGTIYRNKGQDGIWNEYKMTEFETDKTFTLSQLGSDYHVRYTFRPASGSGCDFEYYEWGGGGA